MHTIRYTYLIVVFLLSSGSFAAPPSVPPGKLPSPTPFIFDNDTWIDANLINMLSTNHGSFAFNINVGDAGLEYPTGTNMFAVFASGLWIGALVNQEVRVTVAEYSMEYSPGPMENGGPNPHWDSEHFRVYKIDQNSGPGDPDWDEWPQQEGAPVNELGEPLLMGNQTLWCVYNDADRILHTSPAGSTEPLALEIQNTTFAFDTIGALGYVIFSRYLIVNRGLNHLEDAYIALWSDPDLGGAGDDYVGCDTTLWVGYCYNATNNDPIYAPAPPCVGYDLLQGPIVPSVGDTATVSGEPYPNFRNLIMTSFNMYINGTDPQSAQESYWYMQGLDAVVGQGAPYIDPITGDTTTYVLSGDPVTGTGWLDSNPSDRRFMMSSGPFDLEPAAAHGDSIIYGVTAQEIWAAILIGHGTDRLNSITIMRENDVAAQEFFDGLFLDVWRTPTPSVPSSYALFQNYPNPFNSATVIAFEIPHQSEVKLAVFNILGQTVAELMHGTLPAGSYSIPWDASNLASGIYLCRLQADDFRATRKLVLIK